ncbi:MAG: aldo/keto reductase [Myxococcaceae bacterium]
MTSKRSSLTRLGLGLAALGRPAYMTLEHQKDLPRSRTVANMRAHALAVLDEAWRLGIRHFDAARSYGRSEEFLAAWLSTHRIRRTAITIASKWGYRYVGGWKVRAQVHEVKDHSFAALREQWAETQGHLGSWVSLYQIHSATFATGVLKNREVLDALARIRDDGVRIGLTVTGADQPKLIRAALRIRRGGARLFDAVQATWNLFEPSAGDALALAHAQGVQVIVKEPLANGKLTLRGNRRELAPLLEVAQAHRTTPDAIALAAVLAQPWSDTVLLGAATVEQLRSNVRATGVRLSQAETTALLESLRREPLTYWQERQAIAWR